MARSNRFALVLAGAVRANAALAQTKPMPDDVPYAVLVKKAMIDDVDGDSWSMDGGVCLNDKAREIEKKALDDKPSEFPQTTPIWVGIVTSIIGSIATGAAVILAATHK